MNITHKKLNTAAKAIGDMLITRGLTLATAESCTGGGLGYYLTNVAGSSRWYQGGIISYANMVKYNILSVPTEMLSEHGAVSEPVAITMAKNALACMQADVSIATTGVAGPSGGSDKNPVGSVWIAWASRQFEPCCKHFQFEGSRQQIREQTIYTAFSQLLSLHLS